MNILQKGLERRYSSSEEDNSFKKAAISPIPDGSNNKSQTSKPSNISKHFSIKMVYMGEGKKLKSSESVRKNQAFLKNLK